MIDLENLISSLKCTRITCLLMQIHSPWYELCLYNLKDYDKCFNLHSLWHKTLARKITKNFWKSTLLSWAKVIDNISTKIIKYSIALFGIIRQSRMSPYSVKTGTVRV